VRGLGTTGPARTAGVTAGCSGPLPQAGRRGGAEGGAARAVTQPGRRKRSPPNPNPRPRPPLEPDGDVPYGPALPAARPGPHPTPPPAPPAPPGRAPLTCAPPPPPPSSPDAPPPRSLPLGARRRVPAPPPGPSAADSTRRGSSTFAYAGDVVTGWGPRGGTHLPSRLVPYLLQSTDRLYSGRQAALEVCVAWCRSSPSSRALHVQLL
jgi:hypothetical protein